MTDDKLLNLNSSKENPEEENPKDESPSGLGENLNFCAEFLSKLGEEKDGDGSTEDFDLSGFECPCHSEEMGEVMEKFFKDFDPEKMKKGIERMMKFGASMIKFLGWVNNTKSRMRTAFAGRRAW